MKFNISRLAADHSAAVAAMLPQSPLWNRQQTATARMAGQRAAAEALTWAEVDAFRSLLPAALGPGLAWCGTWGVARIDTVAGAVVAVNAAASILRFDDFTAWLQGVEDVAQAVEAEHAATPAG
jgi:hypothetical protein